MFETRKRLMAQREKLQTMNDRLLGGMKVLAERAEKLEEENEILKIEAEAFKPGYKKAMEANLQLTKQWEKLTAEYAELEKSYKTMEEAFDGNTRTRKKLCNENARLRLLLGSLGWGVEMRGGVLELIKEKAGANA